MASPARRLYMQKRVGVLRARLGADLAATDTEDFIQLLWAIGVLQSGNPAPAARIIRFPPQAATDDFTSRFAVRPWELETLANLAAETHKAELPATLTCRDFNSAARFVNALRTLEDVESGAYVDQETVLNEMHRIGQRQFAWQRGHANNPDVYRSIYLYGQGAAAAFFEQHHRMSIEDFTKTAFGLFVTLTQHPSVARATDFDQIGITPQMVESALNLFALPIDQAAEVLAETVAAVGAIDLPTAYKPSLPRRWPILTFGPQGQRLRAPLPSLVLHRMSAGLYYDLLPGGGVVGDEIARRFEAYCLNLMVSTLPALTIEPEYRYHRAGTGDQVDSPDVLVADQARLTLAVECKATKLTFAAQFADEPAVTAAAKYDELGKGVFQLWRYFSHCRRGLTRHAVDDETCGLVLTLDTWLVMSRELQEHCLANARRRAETEPGMTVEDQKPICFASIQDFERLVLQTDEAGFLRTLAAAKEERFTGWLLPDIRQRNDVQLAEPKPYPFDLSELLVWWAELEELRSARAAR